MIILRTKHFGFYDASGKIKEQFTRGVGKERFERWKNQIIEQYNKKLGHISNNSPLFKLTPEEIEQVLREQSAARDEIVKRIKRNSLEKSASLKVKRDGVEKVNEWIARDEKKLKELEEKLKTVPKNSEKYNQLMKEYEGLEADLGSDYRRRNDTIRYYHDIKTGGRNGFFTNDNYTPVESPYDKGQWAFRRDDTSRKLDFWKMDEFIDKKNEQLKELVKGSNEYQKVANERDTAIELLNTTKEQLGALNTSFNTTNRHLNDEKNINKNLESQIAVYQTKDQVSERQIKDLKHQIEELQKEIKQERSSGNTNANKVIDLQTKLSLAESELSRLTRENAQKTDNINSLTDSNKKLKWGLAGTSALSIGSIGFGIRNKNKDKNS